VFSINHPIEELTHDTAQLAITYCKMVHNYLSTCDGSILNGHRANGFGILILL